MTKSILVGLAVLTLSAPAAFAAHHHHRHHQATTVGQGAGAPPVAPPAGNMGGGQQTQYMKNLHDSGYDPKNDYTSGGTMRDH